MWYKCFGSMNRRRNVRGLGIHSDEVRSRFVAVEGMG